MSKTFKLLAIIAILSISACSSNKDATMEGMSEMDGYTEMDENSANGEGISGEELGEYAPDAKANIAFMSDVVNIVFFDFDSAELGSESRTTLQDQAAWLEVNPGTDVMVEGHCDERGTREYNLALGAKRAAKTQAYLIALGVDASRISTISYGKERPMILDSSDAAWSKNRRAVTILY